MNRRKLSHTLHGENFAGLALMAVWFNLGAALALPGIHHGIPWWSYLAGLFLGIFYFAANGVGGDVIPTENVRWLIAMPVLGPLLLIAYIAWASIPRWRAALSPNLASAAL